MDQEPDYYAILHLKSTCSQEEIRDQFKKMVKIFHPDLHQGDEWCQEQLRLCNHAYEVLGDPDRRRAYDLRAAGVDSVTAFTFDAGIRQDEKFDEMDEPWIFQAAEKPETANQQEFVFESPPLNSPQASQLEFSSGVISAAWPKSNPRPIEEKKPRKSSQLLVGAAGFAALTALIVILTAENQPIRRAASPPTSTAFTDFSALHSQDVSSSTVAPPIQDIQASANQDKIRAKQASKDVAPYWTRYELDQKIANDAISDAVRNVHGGKRQTLTSQSKALRQTSTEIQYQFDDITYGSSSDVSSATSHLANKLSSLETQIHQIQTLAPTSSRAKSKTASSHIVTYHDNNLALTTASPAPAKS